MSKGTISGGGTDGQYDVSIERIDGTPEVMSAWCCDLTEDLSGTVGVIEIAGDLDKGVNIQPGYEGNAVYDAERDGELQLVPRAPGKEGHQAGVYWNWAMRPGWQKWRPNYRYGTITAIDHDADTCSVTLDECLSTDTPDGAAMDINQSAILSNVEIEYMDCNSAPFEVGDEVLVKFEGNDWANPKVIGFKANPKGCGQWIIVTIYTGSCTVLNLKTGAVATNIPTNAGPDAVFPCSATQISNWRSELTEISADDLFEKEYNTEASWSDPEYARSEVNNGGSCGGGEFWDDIVITETFTKNHSVDSIWGDAQTAIYDYTRVHRHITACPFEPDPPEHHQTDSLERSKNTKIGFKLTPTNGGSTPISYWTLYEHDEEAESVVSTIGELECTGTQSSISAFASKTDSYDFGGENYYLTPPDQVSRNCATEVCNATMVEPGPWSDDCYWDWDGSVFSYGTFPYECTPEEIDVTWPGAVYCKAHYFDDNNVKGIVQVFSYLPDDLEDMQAYVSIGDDPDEEPVDVPQNAAATAAVLALMQTGANPFQARIDSVKYYKS